VGGGDDVLKAELAGSWAAMKVRVGGLKLRMQAGDAKALNKEVRQLIEEQVVDILNGGNEAELMALYGVGPKRAQYIIEFRKQNKSGFTGISDLKEIGMSAKQVTKIAKVLVSNQLHCS